MELDDSDIKYHLYTSPEIERSIKNCVKNFPESMASLVYRYKGALSLVEFELGGVIGYDSSCEWFEAMEKFFQPLIDYCAELAAKKETC